MVGKPCQGSMINSWWDVSKSCNYFRFLPHALGTSSVYQIPLFQGWTRNTSLWPAWGILARIFLAQLGAMKCCRKLIPNVISIYIKCFTSTSLRVCNEKSLHQQTTVAFWASLVALVWLHNPLWIPCSTICCISRVPIPKFNLKTPWIFCQTSTLGHPFLPNMGEPVETDWTARLTGPEWSALSVSVEGKAVCTWKIRVLANNNQFHFCCNYCHSEKYHWLKNAYLKKKKFAKSHAHDR